MGKYMTIVAAAAAVLTCVSGAQADIVMDWVTVGDPGNVGEWSGESQPLGWGPDAIVGGVAETYNIGKYEVTAGQYTEFLNAVADDDTHGLYNTQMWSDVEGCKIEQTGSSPNYTYSVAPDRADRPVDFVNWYDVLRFANWMHNGQPTGAQDALTTEDGAYEMSLGESVVRKPGAQVFLPTEDEWYKAAYYKGGGTNAGYWDYPTSSDDVPGRDMTEATNPGNNANYQEAGGVPIDPPYTYTVSGEFELSDSPYGTFDQGGNAIEWNESLISDTRRGRRGGAAVYPATGNMLASFRDLWPPTAESSYGGFRVAELFADCNNNGVLDRCDVDCGSLGGFCDVEGCGEGQDCNSDGFPDDCQLLNNDCNEDGAPDDCQLDTDNDGWPDPNPPYPSPDNNCDNCPDVFNPSQHDSDADGIGDLCDNCPSVENPGQEDGNEDGIGDVCPCPERGDMNDDGSVDGNDIQLFVEKLLGG